MRHVVSRVDGVGVLDADDWCLGVGEVVMRHVVVYLPRKRLELRLGPVSMAGELVGNENVSHATLNVK